MSCPSTRLPLRGSQLPCLALGEGSRAHSSKWGSKPCLQRREAPAPALWGIGVAHTRGRNCGLCGPSVGPPQPAPPVTTPSLNTASSLAQHSPVRPKGMGHQGEVSPPGKDAECHPDLGQGYVPDPVHGEPG